MRLRVVWFLLVLAGMASCKKEKEERPPLSRDEMAGLMMEIYLGEARMSITPVSKDSAYRLFIPYQDSVLRHRGVADSTLRKAYDYYLRHPDELEKIYDAIIDSLSLREQLQRTIPIRH
ncbi:MAG: DUF4296 domain-containing protein [Cyclobacteriaceae bacterium]|nr:DUF4296 domain-containing protein [Cyclobacteriaceae bacterium]